MAKHEDLPVPTYSTLEPVYGESSQLEEARLRFDKIKSKFQEVFSNSPEVFARSPGLASFSLLNFVTQFDDRRLILCVFVVELL